RTARAPAQNSTAEPRRDGHPERVPAVPQSRCAVMVTAVERSAVADATGSVHGFPAALTSFVGRAGVVDEVVSHLAQYRLVTVTGPGGSGKTRLSGEVARQVACRFADGVWLGGLGGGGGPGRGGGGGAG